jgi:DNA/RNA-binding domain of Phe-tRNA-synthetase-like protein
MTLFAYDPDLLESFPTIHGGVIHASGLENGPSSEALLDAYFSEQRAVIDAIGATPLSEIRSIAAWRRAFSTFGVKPTQYRNAAEALLRRLTKAGDIPSINTLVDIGNLVAIRHRLPVAVFDQREVAGGTTVRFADGTERFDDLGGSDSISPEPGEVVFADATGLVSARRWCWRQSRQSAAGPQTTDAVITVEGHHETAAEDVEAALHDLLELLAIHQPAAATRSAHLSPDNPSFG